MEQRALGGTGLTISAIGLGCVNFGREIDEDASYRVMDYAVEQGITFFDTAESYGGGQSRLTRSQSFGADDRREVSGEMSSSERIIGDWMRMRGCREQITLCTKVSTGASAENIPRALTASLQRLGTDYVDIYKIHTPDPETPISETLAALTAEVETGRIRVIGCSNYTVAQLREAVDVSAAKGYRRYEITQPVYNLLMPEAEEEFFSLCQKKQIAVTPYSPLAGGFLAGKYASDRSQIPAGSRFHIMPTYTERYFTSGSFRVVERLRQKSSALGVPMAQVSLAWAMTHPAVTTVLIGPRTTRHIDDAVAAYEMVMDEALRSELSGLASSS